MSKATTRRSEAAPDALWAHHHGMLRDPAQVAAQWEWPQELDPALLEYRVRGAWWEILDRLRISVLVSREYEHLLLALGVRDGRPRISHFRLPHPSGIAVDHRRGLVYVASTRNPNMLFRFAPCRGYLNSSRDETTRFVVPALAGIGQRLTQHNPLKRALQNGPLRRDADGEEEPGLLLPVGCRYLPGSLYLHDLAMIGGRLHANAVGLNAVIRFPRSRGFEVVWWPRSIDGRQGPRFEKNYLQMNSIAAGGQLQSSYFSASTAAPSGRRPGHLNFPVDGRGVIFAGATREVIATGLTRPHSARRLGRELWVDNSGYGQFGRIVDGRFEPLVKLGGWTRGLCFCRGIALVGTSRVLPKFRGYAPGLDVAASECGVHAIEISTGRVLGSLVWPAGNQIFAIEAVDAGMTRGFPAAGGGRNPQARSRELFFRGLSWPGGNVGKKAA